MEATKTTKRVDVLSEAVRRYVREFGDRLEAIYAVNEDLYEPEDEDDAIHIVLLLKDEQPFVDSEPMARIFDELIFEYQSDDIDVHTLDAETTVARQVQAEGVRLW